MVSMTNNEQIIKILIKHNYFVITDTIINWVKYDIMPIQVDIFTRGVND